MEFKFYNVIPVYPVLLYDYNDNYVLVKYPLILFKIAEDKCVSVIPVHRLAKFIIFDVKYPYNVLILLFAVDKALDKA